MRVTDTSEGEDRKSIKELLTFFLKILLNINSRSLSEENQVDFREK